MSGHSLGPSPALLKLLHRLVDRLDSAEQRGSSAAQSVALGERLWPELYGAIYESEKAELWDQLRLLCKQGWVQLTPAAAQSSSSGYALGAQARVRVLDAQALRRATARPERQKSLPERWREAVFAELQASDDTKVRVSGYCLDLPPHSMEEVVQRLNELRELEPLPLLLREVSSRLFWGMSKALDARQDLVAAVLGREDCPFPSAPIQLLVHLPAGPLRGVLFIENQMSYEQAQRNATEAFDGLALLYSAGFKASAVRLRQPQGSSLYYSRGSSTAPERRGELEQWLYRQPTLRTEDTPVHFWGDLDWAGMQILASLRAGFPGVQAWQPGYVPLLRCLKNGGGHAPELAEKSGQRAIASTGCPFADGVLLPALRESKRFVDQEITSLFH